eukprot:NODE_291_length_10603_cov_1.029703.p6 type:complete len:279 gc:universal NODE_291_length_10603_cov_1.029703:9573-10409(+)
MDQQTNQQIPDAATIKKYKQVGYFGYEPDVNLCYITIGIYSFLTILLAIQNYFHVKKKKYFYLMALTASGLAEIAGYVGRIYTIDDPNLPNFIVMDCFLLLTPNLLAFVEYKTVGKIMRKYGIDKAWNVIPAKSVSRLFVTSDVVSFCVQSTAAYFLTSGKEDDQPIGKVIMLTGLGIQIGFFTGFFVLMTYVFFKVNELRMAFLALFIQMGCLYVRGVYRIIEFANNNTAEINKHEYYFYYFDTLLIGICLVTYNVFYFARYLDKPVISKEIAINKD